MNESLKIIIDTLMVNIRPILPEIQVNKGNYHSTSGNKNVLLLSRLLLKRAISFKKKLKEEYNPNAYMHLA